MTTMSAAVAAMALAFGSTAQADTWEGAGGTFPGGDGISFEDVNNWNTGAQPTTQTAVINNGDTVIRNASVEIERTAVTGGSTLNITGGTQQDTKTGSSTRNDLGRGGVGTINQSGGSFNIGHMLAVGSAGNGNGTFNLSGGDLIISRGSNSRIDGTGGRPSLDVGQMDAVAGLFEVSGGSLATRVGAVIGETGTFSVVGSTASSIGIGSNQSADGWWIQKAGGVLRSGVDAGGITAILIDDVGDDGLGLQGNATFDLGSILDPYDAGGTVPNVWNTVMTWEGSLTDNGLGLSTAATTAGWEKQIVGSNLQVRLTAVPEPTSLAVLGLSGLVLIGRRRKKA